MVLAALIAAVPATIAATASILNRRQLRTGNGVTIGQIAAQMMRHIQDDCIHEECDDENHTHDLDALTPRRGVLKRILT